MDPTLVICIFLCCLSPAASTSDVYNTTPEPIHCMTLEWGLIGGAIGMVIAAVAAIVVFCLYRRMIGNAKKSIATLEEVKRELENQKRQLEQQLQDIETERDENKAQLQRLETSISDNESFDRKSLLLGQKEELLKSQWELDVKKKQFERQKLNIERALEPTEIKKLRKINKSSNI